MTEGPIGPHLWRLAMPMAVGLVSVVGFNVVDVWFVARLGGDALAAIAFTIPVVMAIGSIGIGSGIGVTAVLSQVVGRGDSDRARVLASHAIWLALAVAGAVVGLLALVDERLFALLGAPSQLQAPIAEYMNMWLFAVPMMLMPMAGAGVMRAHGDTATPARITIASMLANVVLDPILIFGLGPVPAMGLRGAALATVIARCLMVLLQVRVLVFRDRRIGRVTAAPREVLASWRAVMVVALPAAAAHVAGPLTLGIITPMAAAYGPAAVAALGAGSRIELLVMVPIAALAGGMTPFVGQNHGASNRARIVSALRLGFGFSVAFGGVIGLLMAGLSGPIAGLFSDDAAIRSLLGWYLIAAPLGYWARGMLHVGNAAHNATGAPSLATGLVLLRTPVLAVVCALIGGAAWGAVGLFVGLAVADVVAGIVALWVVRRRFMHGRE